MVDEAVAPEDVKHVPRGWLRAARLAALLGIVALAWPVYITHARGLESWIALATIAVPVILVYLTILWLLRSDKRSKSIAMGQSISQVVGVTLLVATAGGILQDAGSFLAIFLVLGLAPAALLVTGSVLARTYPARRPIWLFAIGIFLAVLVLFVLAVPSGHPPNYGARTRGTLWMIVSAEAAYRATTGGFGRPDCLHTPGDCIAGYPEEAPVFLREEDVAAVQSRYLFVFHPGTPGEAARHTGEVQGALDGFAVTALPLIPGLPSYCSDETGIILRRADGRVPGVENARCVEDEGAEPAM